MRERPASGEDLPAGEEERLWRRAADADERARERLVRHYLPFAEMLARRYHTAREPHEDLEQVARMGLVKAVARFEPERGVPFKGFAAPTILGELKRHFRDRVWMVRVPRSIQEGIAEIEAATTGLAAELQRMPSVREIAARVGREETEVLEILEANQRRRPSSIDRTVRGDDGDAAPAAELIGGEDDGFELVEGRLAIERELPHLDERERRVIALRFAADMTQSQIAAEIGCSQMQVSRILRRALDKLRERAAG
ncbi:MAG: SigB/SigF/SigG family RNA polymerase sigma factor [Acidobacteria bacterium]|nr:MAG: SigB/SigF/SigG family RNA polymerase sigma factor [Acidobacteriota bacterium]GIK77435.1 MAG: alternative sigma factor SigF [Actinomycetes bacterium]